MKKHIMALLAAGCLFASCTEEKKVENPFLAEWDTPYAIPPFESIKNEHYKPAFNAAMDAENKEINDIINNPDTPDFENTIVAYNRAGELMSKVYGVFGNISSVASNDEILAIETDLSPVLSAHYNEIMLNDKLFQRIKSVYDRRDSLGLDLIQKRLVEETYKSFEIGGSNLPADKKEELKKLNTEISALQLKFGQNLLKETADFKLIIDKKEDLSGLTEGQIAEAASRAEAAGESEKWIFGLDNPSIMPFLANSDNAELREKILNAYLSRCNNGNDFDNKQVIKDLINLRLKRAQLMGFDNAASFILQTRMAKEPSAVYGLLDQIWKPAIKTAEQERTEMISLMKKETGRSDFKASDWRYYAQKVMKNKYNVSEEELAPYFKLENVRNGIFYVANRLYGLTFNQLDSVPLPHSEATAFEVIDADSSLLGVVFFDMFARPGEKRGGAWCSSFRSQKYKDGKRVAPIVTIVGNFTRPVGDKPALLTTDEVETYFHEFGHGIDALLSDVKYEGLNSVPRDFVELPSQINEHWAFAPEVLNIYAKHYQTGEVIPFELVEKLDKAGKYGQGFATVEYLAASYLDMDYHTLKEIPQDIDINEFETKVLGDRGLLAQIPSRYKSSYFNHTFGGGYTAGYYSYIWAEVLDADAFEAFLETGDIFNRDVASKFRCQILARGNEDDAMVLYKNFRGKTPGIEPLLKNRGLK